MTRTGMGWAVILRGALGGAVVLTMLGAPAQGASVPVEAASVETVAGSAASAKVKPRRLVLAVKGQRLGKKAKIVVRGVKGRAKGTKRAVRVKKRRTLRNLRPGVYRIVARKIAASGRVARPKVSRKKVRVTKRRGAVVTIRYTRGVPPATGRTPSTPAPPSPPVQSPTPKPPGAALSRQVSLPPGTTVPLEVAPELVTVTTLDEPVTSAGVSLTKENGTLLVSASANTAPGAVELLAAGTGCTSQACDTRFSLTVSVTVLRLAAPPGEEINDFLEPSADRVAQAEVVSPGLSALVDEVTIVVRDGAGGPRAVADAAAESVGAVVVGGNADSRAFQLRWPTPQDIGTRLAELVALQGVRSAEAGLLVETSPTVVDASDEPAYGGDTWNLDVVNARAAWAAGATGSGVTIGILEALEGGVNGMVAQHEDLPAVRYGAVRGGDSKHATKVAGLACAQDNGIGVVGVAPECSLVSSQLGGEMLLQGYVDLLQEQVDAGARVINNSWGWGAYCSGSLCRQRNLEDIQRLHDQYLGDTNSMAAWLTGPGADTVVVSSAGNVSMPIDSTVITALGRRGGARNVVTVAAIDRNGNLARYSNFGPEVDIAAPGGSDDDRLMTTLPGDEYEKMGGTSAAAPMVAGAAALVAQKHPDLDGATIAGCVRSSATTLVTARNDEEGLYFGFGGRLPLLDAGAAVQCGFNPDTLAGGYLHTCAIDTTGQAWCWGSDGSGRLGDGDDGQADEYAPVPVSGGHTFTRLTAGYNHTCGLDDRGKAWCWGGDDFGQVGDGTAGQTFFVYEPVAVAGGHSFTHLAAGDYHTCGIDGAGEAWCWGSDADGQIGDGDDGQANEFAPVAVDGARTFTDLAAGGSHTCAIDDIGLAYCWGRDGDGQIGDGDDGQASQYVPVKVAGPGGRRFSHLAVGGRHTCGTDTVGRTWCWGAGDVGQVGDGDASQVDRTVPALVAGGHTFTRLTAGGAHSCGIDNFNKAWCWGSDTYRQVGDGSADQGPKLVPVPVAGEHLVTHLAAGYLHTCSIDTAGAARCWGWDFYGQVGDGAADQSSKPEPTAVAGGKYWQQN